jgi:hypothetical protein
MPKFLVSFEVSIPDDTDSDVESMRDHIKVEVTDLVKHSMELQDSNDCDVEHEVENIIVQRID